MLLVVVIGLVALLLLQEYTGTDDPQATTPSPSDSSTSSAPASPSTDEAGSLPPQVLDTIALIQDDGPFPYRQDGSVFMNRERRLPAHERGYWREYTVTTPGESDRGARRIVHGRGDEFYYTDDHYQSFTLLDVPSLVPR